MSPPEIHFYRVGAPWGDFSNFALWPITLDGLLWPTSEHYFQACKFINAMHADAIRLCPSPREAARLGRERHRPLRADWDAVKDDVMRRALHAKFTQHSRLTELLRSTGEAVLVEHTTNDAYWADAGDGSGLNRLGVLLMELRDELGAPAGASPSTDTQPCGGLLGALRGSVLAQQDLIEPAGDDWEADAQAPSCWTRNAGVDAGDGPQ